MERHGFIRSELELKALILYVMTRVSVPVTFPQLSEMVLCDDAIDYFEYINCLNDLVRTEHVHREHLNDEETFFISRKGRVNLDICASNLPASVRERADKAASKITRSLARAGSVDSSLLTRPDGSLAVSCKLRDDSGEILSLELSVLTRAQGEELSENFKNNAEKIYNALLSAMLL